MAPTAIRQWEPTTSPPPSRPTTTCSPRTSALSARERLSTVMPDSSKTRWMTAAASGSWPGSTCERDETSVTFTPSAV